MTDADKLIAELRDFVAAWLDDPHHNGHIYELIRMEGEGADRHERSYQLTTGLLGSVADALSEMRDKLAAEKREHDHHSDLLRQMTDAYKEVLAERDRLRGIVERVRAIVPSGVVHRLDEHSGEPLRHIIRAVRVAVDEPAVATEPTTAELSEFHALRAQGLSEAEAQGTVWPEPPAEPNPVQITEEMVERAARAVLPGAVWWDDSYDNAGDPRWPEEQRVARDGARREARRALTAALNPSEEN